MNVLYVAAQVAVIIAAAAVTTTSVYGLLALRRDRHRRARPMRAVSHLDDRRR